jgi:hypothetical protein
VWFQQNGFRFSAGGMTEMLLRVNLIVLRPKVYVSLFNSPMAFKKLMLKDM